MLTSESHNIMESLEDWIILHILESLINLAPFEHSLRSGIVLALALFEV